MTVDKMGDRSHLVQTDKGKTYRRNRKFIRTIPDTAEQPQPERATMDVSASESKIKEAKMKESSPIELESSKPVTDTENM